MPEQRRNGVGLDSTRSRGGANEKNLTGVSVDSYAGKNKPGGIGIKRDVLADAWAGSWGESTRRAVLESRKWK